MDTKRRDHWVVQHSVDNEGLLSMGEIWSDFYLPLNPEALHNLEQMTIDNSNLVDRFQPTRGFIQLVMFERDIFHVIHIIGVVKEFEVCMLHDIAQIQRKKSLIYK